MGQFLFSNGTTSRVKSRLESWERLWMKLARDAFSMQLSLDLTLVAFLFQTLQKIQTQVLRIKYYQF